MTKEIKNVYINTNGNNENRNNKHNEKLGIGSSSPFHNKTQNNTPLSPQTQPIQPTNKQDSPLKKND
jgi:hypothetical protein